VRRRSLASAEKAFVIPGEEKIACEEHEERAEKENVIKIPDMAFVT
jgi:hypothetical protein